MHHFCLLTALWVIWIISMMETHHQDASPTVTITAARHVHVVVVPYPSRGHINPMLNLSNSLVSNNPHTFVTFVTTQQWLPSITESHKPHNNIKIRSIPNLVPDPPNSSTSSCDSFLNTVEAVMTKMEPPFERLLDELQQPPTAIVYDGFLFWAVGIGRRRNIPVAAFWTSSTSEFWVQCFHILQQNEHRKHQKLLENGDKLVDYIPGISWIRLADIPLLDGNNQQILDWALKSCEVMLKSDYMLFPTVYELEPHVIDALKARLNIPIYTVGPNIPYFGTGLNSCSLSDANVTGHSCLLEWLDSQPSCSVLYISYGSFLSVSSPQMDEIAAALHDSGVRFLWVAREESSRLKEICGEMGLVLTWCDQLSVLLHPAIGGYWTHCGWNSIMEGVYAGVTFLTFPLAMDQPLTSKIVVEDWRVGWRVKKDDKCDTLVRRDEIVVLLRKFMQLDSDLGRDMRKRAKELQRMCQLAIAKDGSSQINIKAFVQSVQQSAVPKGSNGPQDQVRIENLN